MANEDRGTMNYRVVLPDLNYYRQAIKCQFACPAGTDARGYVNAIARGEYELAYYIARESNPLASICGRVCNAPCEAACRRGNIDAPIAIRALKRFVAERYGPEADREASTVRPAEASALPFGTLGTLTSHGRLALRQLAQKARAFPLPGGRSHGRVAVIGAGPAGLACAHDLALLGHTVTIFEAAPVPGGMLILGIPEYRLPREVLHAEIEAILSLGIELQLNVRLGRDLSLADLRQEYDAIFIAIGAHRSRDLNIEGVQLDGVFRAVDFLLNVNLGHRVELGQRVIVVGGGGVALDAARSAARLGLRQGAGWVHVVCLEAMKGTVPEDPREEMPATAEEVADALEEGIQIHTRRGPKRILGQDGRVFGLETISVSRVWDRQGRFNPEFIPGTEEILEADNIILAIGQTSDLSFIQPHDGIEISPRGTIVVDRETLATTAPGVYAGGDVAFGPRIIIEAVADGQRAARAIDAYLRGKRLRVTRHGWMTVVPDHRMPAGYEAIPRRRVPALPLDRRIGIAEVELGYSEPQAVEQALRCLKCHLNVILDSDKCVLCGGCVDVCPRYCLKMVSVDRLSGDEDVVAVIKARYGLPPEDVARLAAGTAMIMDGERCIRCGLCARRCPTGAINIEAFHFVEEMEYA